MGAWPRAWWKTRAKVARDMLHSRARSSTVHGLAALACTASRAGASLGSRGRAEPGRGGLAASQPGPQAEDYEDVEQPV